MDDGPVLLCKDLRKRFKERLAVDGVGFEVAPGETYGLLGPNGAGKTTTISMVCGLLRRDGGEVTVAGASLDEDPGRVKAAIGFVPQDVALYPDLSGLENLRFWGRMYGLAGRELSERVEATLEVVGLTERAGDKVAAYSGGMQRRLNIAGRHYRKAVGHAERSGSDVLAGYMLGSMALWAAETGRLSEAASLLGQARRSIPHAAPPTVHAWLAAIEATAHASAGDADAALAVCKRAETAVAAGHEPMWPWLFPFDAAKLASYVGACATRLRLPRTALPALTEALDGLGPARTKQRALVLADLAVNHRALGDDD